MHQRPVRGRLLWLGIGALVAMACAGGGSEAPTPTAPGTAVTGPTHAPVGASPAPMWVEVPQGQPPQRFYDYAVNVGTGRLWRLEPATSSPSNASTARFLTWSADGQAVVALMIGGQSRLYTAPPGGPFSAFLPTLSRDASAAAFSPDGRLVAVRGEETEILEIASERSIARLKEPAATLAGWSSDSRFLAMSRVTDTATLLVWDRRTGWIESIPALPGGWSNSGARLAYFPEADVLSSPQSPQVSEVRIRDFETGEDTRLIAAPSVSAGPMYWSSDDAYLAASFFRVDRWRTLVINVAKPSDGFSLTGSWATGWSPRENTLLLTGNVCTTFDVFTVQADGTKLRNYTASADADIDPRWSPDGRHVAFPTFATDRVVLTEIGFPEGDRRELVSAPVGDQLGILGWSHDGRHIAFSYGGGRGPCEAVQPEDTTVEPLP